MNRTTTINPLRSVRHMAGLHKRVISPKKGKGSYTRKGRREDCHASA